MTFSFTDGVQGLRRDAVSNGETDVHTHTHTHSFDLVYAKSFIRQYRLSKTLNVRTLLLSLVSITYGIKTVINMALLLVFPIVT